MVENEIEHPDAARLADFGLGKLSGDEAKQIEDHVAQCESCCHTLSSLGDDTFADLIRSSPNSGDPAGDPASGSAVNPREAATLPPVRAATSSTDFELPDELSGHSRYRFLELVGTGGMGAVYKAEHRLMQRTVAVKVISGRLTHNAAAVERFRREVKAAARLSHPNIVTAYDSEQAGSLQLLVMEFVEGTNLAELIRDGRGLPVAQACDYIRQAAVGLQHAFEFGMVHRDIKPHNLMLTPTGQVKILDFGLAQLVGEGDLTKEGSMMGTPDYMAPEQARDASQTDIRSDIYSLGCTLYALLTGQPPFPEGSEIVKAMAHIEREPKPVSEFRDDVPDELIVVLKRMTAKRPQDRYQTPAEAANALQPFLAASGIVAAPPRRFGWKIAAGLAGVALLLAGVIFVVTDNGQLRIESSEEVEVVVNKDGHEYAVIDVATGSTVRRLYSGTYEIALKSETELQLSQSEFTLRRGGEVVVDVIHLSDQEQAALKAARAWLEIIDEDKFAESRDEMAEMVRSSITGDQWTARVAPIREQIGRVVDRRLKQARYTREVPDAPKGDWVTLQFDSYFKKGGGARETVTATLEANGEWRVASYVVRPRPGAERPVSAGATATQTVKSLSPADAGKDSLSDKERAALKAARAWLEIIDEDKFAESRDEMAAMVRSSITGDQWTARVAPIRAQIGRLVDRQLKQARYTTEVPDAPKGDWVTLQFDSYFEKGGGARETVTTTLELDGQWRVASYVVRPRPGAQRPPAAKQPTTETVRSFGAAEATITQDGVTSDQGGWKIQSDQPRTVRLFEVDDVGIENARLVYRAKLKTENLNGKAYLEMWVRIPQHGESFSRGLDQTVSGTTGWATYEIPFFLQPGQKADLAKLNVAIEGTGTVWIKDIELLKTPL